MHLKCTTTPCSAIVFAAISSITIYAINTGDTADHSDGLPQYVVHPQTIKSPNSLFSISIEPSNLNGRGSGEYVCTSSQGKVLWAKTLPFTLWSGQVTDQGTLVGYAYTQGVEGHHRDDGDVVVVAITVEGSTLVEEATARTAPRFFHAPPTPMVNAIEMDAANDRFLVRWDDPDINRRIEKCKELQYFDKNGKSLRVVDLEKAWGHEPNYVAEISAANDGGLMIYDFGGTPSYVEMNGTGVVRHSMDARIERDRPVLHSIGPPRVSPSGQLWLSNRTSLFRVGRDGLVDHTIGAVLDYEMLGEVDFSMVATSDRSTQQF